MKGAAAPDRAARTKRPSPLLRAGPRPCRTSISGPRRPGSARPGCRGHLASATPGAEVAGEAARGRARGSGVMVFPEDAPGAAAGRFGPGGGGPPPLSAGWPAPARWRAVQGREPDQGGLAEPPPRQLVPTTRPASRMPLEGPVNTPAVAAEHVRQLVSTQSGAFGDGGQDARPAPRGAVTGAGMGSNVVMPPSWRSCWFQRPGTDVLGVGRQHGLCEFLAGRPLDVHDLPPGGWHRCAQVLAPHRLRGAVARDADSRTPCRCGIWKLRLQPSR